jgi:hypothetical protein
LKHDIHNYPSSEQSADGARCAAILFDVRHRRADRTSRADFPSWHLPRTPSRTANVDCRMKRKCPVPVNRCGNSSSCRENRYTRPISIVSMIAAGMTATITTSASTGHDGLAAQLHVRGFSKPAALPTALLLRRTSAAQPTYPPPGYRAASIAQCRP